MNKILSIILILAALSVPAFARGPHHGPMHHGSYRPHHGPVYVERYHGGHHHHGPSRGWYNGALVVGATLAGLELISDIINPPQPVVVEKTVHVPVPVQQPVIYQQPVVQPQPTVVYVQPQPQVQTQPTVIYTTQPTVQYYQPPVVVTPSPNK